MRVILQRVRQGRVTVAGVVSGAIETGLVALVGVTHADTPAEADQLARKTAGLRIFDDAACHRRHPQRQPHTRRSCRRNSA